MRSFKRMSRPIDKRNTLEADKSGTGHVTGQGVVFVAPSFYDSSPSRGSFFPLDGLFAGRPRLLQDLFPDSPTGGSEILNLAKTRQTRIPAEE